ncbi:MAG: hypothetical protein RIS94_1322 [Pseudomonadota bacterium]
MLSILDMLRTHARQTPDAPCLSAGDETLSFGEMDKRASRIANALAATGVRPGDRVAVLAPACAAVFEIAFGCAKAGAIMMPLNWRLSATEIAAILDDGAPAILLVDDSLSHLATPTALTPPRIALSAFAAWRDSAPADDEGLSPTPLAPALLLYTSGTTGVPKGVVIGHGALACNARTAREVWGFTAASVNLVAMPLFHIGGIGYGMMALSQGGHTVILPQPDPAAVFTALERFGVTHAFFVPTVIQRLIDHLGGEALHDCTLQRLIYGAAPIGEALLAKAIATFGCQFNHAYGMTETAGTVVSLPAADHDPTGAARHRLRACGLPLPWAEVVIVDPATGLEAAPGAIGEIRVRSPMVMLGYWRKPAATAEVLSDDGWLRTGDAASRDADGYITIRDRYKDMIVSGGENIYPAELENVLQFHPAVAEVAVIGVPHESWGETPRAYVVLRPEQHADAADLIAFVREKLARYKAPSSVLFVDALPRNASGKILKHELRRLAAQEEPSR